MARTKTTRARETPERLDAAIARARRDVARELPRADKGQSEAALLSARADGWGSILTGLGTETHDRRTSHRMMAARHTYEELANIYRGDDMAARIVDRPADDMTREGWDLGVGDDDEIAEEIEERCDELNVDALICDALKKRGWCGGGAIFLGVVDGAGDPKLPLDEGRVQDLAFLQVYDARELYPASYYADPISPKYGEPATYFLRPQVGVGSVYGNAGAGRVTPIASTGLLEVHETRIVPFRGVVVNRIQQRETLGWGDSLLERPFDVIRDFGIGWGSAVSLLVDFAQGVFKMQGLAEAVQAGDSEVIKQRMALIQLQRSVLRSVLLDKEEEFKREPTPMGGLAEILSAMCVRLAAAADIPVTLLLGQSPAGLNATGDSDLRNYYDRTRAKQTREVLPALKRIVRVLMLAKRGPTKGVEPDRWRIEFRPLWTPSAKEESEIQLNDANADATRVNAGILMPEEAALGRFSGSRYSRQLRIDVEGRRRFLAENPVDPDRLEEPEPAPAPADPNAPPPGKKPPPADE